MLSIVCGPRVADLSSKIVIGRLKCRSCGERLLAVVQDFSTQGIYPGFSFTYLLTISMQVKFSSYLCNNDGLLLIQGSDELIDILEVIQIFEMLIAELSHCRIRIVGLKRLSLSLFRHWLICWYSDCRRVVCPSARKRHE